VYINKKREAMTTLKYNCSFRLKSYLLSCGQWSVNVIDETHNHKKAKRFEGHKYVEWLKSEKAGIDVLDVKEQHTPKKYSIDD
jgi:hypothetical protein